MRNKNYIYLGLVCVVMILAATFLFNKKGDTEKIVVSPSATPSLSESPSPTPVMSLKPSVKPTPGIIAKENRTYMDWATELDASNRYFVLDENCTSINPSNLTLKNNVLIMLDNSYSAMPRTLRIGDLSYDLKAHDWHLTTLYSAKVPVDLSIFCGGVELGSIRLQ